MKSKIKSRSAKSGSLWANSARRKKSARKSHDSFEMSDM
jgi:hypothetical protein